MLQLCQGTLSIKYFRLAKSQVTNRQSTGFLFTHWPWTWNVAITITVTWNQQHQSLLPLRFFSYQTGELSSIFPVGVILKFQRKVKFILIEPSLIWLGEFIRKQFNLKKLLFNFDEDEMGRKSFSGRKWHSIQMWGVSKPPLTSKTVSISLQNF